MGIADILQPFASSLTYICVLVLATFAITLIFKTSTTTNFAQGSIAVFGCYFGTGFLINNGIPMWLATIIGILFGMVCGVFIDAVIFRRGRHVNLAGKQIITMGLVSVIANLIPMIYYYVDTPRIPSFLDIEHFKIQIGDGVLNVTPHSVVCVIITIVVLTVLFLLLRFSKWGLGVRTTASNEYVAQMMGVNTHVITAVTWGIAGGLGALAAMMYVGGPGSMNGPYFMTDFQVNSFLAGILGGFSTFFGPIAAAVLIPVARTAIGLLASVDGLEIITQYDVVIVYMLTLIIILIKPNGLFGKRIAKKV
ncbi:MAG: branched-chain amino acid ABC transporter permease [Bacilli bacterium]|nr:branched-chain amino acid ABC transporter permease [Bacilli bacterium]